MSSNHFESSTKFDSRRTHDGKYVVIADFHDAKRVVIGAQEELYFELLLTIQSEKKGVCIWAPKMRSEPLNGKALLRLVNLGLLSYPRAEELRRIMYKGEDMVLVEKQDTIHPSVEFMKGIGWDAVRERDTRTRFIAGDARYTFDSKDSSWELRTPQGARVWANPNAFIQDFQQAIS